MTHLKRLCAVPIPRYVTLAVGFSLGLVAAPAFAVTYLPDTAPTADISHNTTETIPAPTTRTSIGIKETVTCAINNWSDRDIRVDGSVQTYVSDNYGTINWSAGTGTCNPTMGPTTTYTAPESSSDTSDTVTMNADDSPLGDDAAINVTLTFTIKVPSGHSNPCILDSEHPYAAEAAGNPNMGADTYFRPQVTPTDVSFKNVSFRENYPAATQYWPNGDVLTRGAAAPAWTVAPFGGSANYWVPVDERGTGYPYNKSKLVKMGTAQDAVMVFSVPWEFQSGGTWHEFTDPPAYFKFYSSDSKAQASFDTQYGRKQGPYP